MGYEKNNDYVEVNERLLSFRTKHPEGSLQPRNPDRPYTVEEIGGQIFIVYVAAAYRTPDDPRPGIGVAQESFPGKTPYTRGSEIQNAETSAWGRAMVAALAADTKRGVASAAEVRNRQAEQDALEQLQADVFEAYKESGLNRDRLMALFGQCGGEGKVSDCTDHAVLTALLSAIKSADATGAV
ncbi:hypothetical protein D5S18_03095 [Nocardia panacis]|uniref:Uncharacterized protein n=1 Tax=Nocardia panacis TaxID=2340916 RepID=A0A3A4KPD6_9NOCA|nr:hypothetical protein [Nocardia panacis]RJO79332.1 hypothetical protein D5S18_03095 [Nocardia panacis]